MGLHLMNEVAYCAGRCCCAPRILRRNGLWTGFINNGILRRKANVSAKRFLLQQWLKCVL